MRALSAADLLRIWDGDDQGRAAERALHLLSAVNAEATPDQFASLSIGARDAQLLRLRQRTFGELMEAQTCCPQCHEQLEFTLPVAELIAPRAAEPTDAQTWHGFDDGVWQLRFRLPNSADVLAIAGNDGAAKHRARLIARCVAEVRRAGTSTAVAELPEPLLAALAARMEVLDPCADISVALTCPGCSASWQAQFDILGYLWAEITVHARRLLREVDALARAYGWREADILALSSRRRRAYLDIGGA